MKVSLLASVLALGLSATEAFLPHGPRVLAPHVHMHRGARLMAAPETETEEEVAPSTAVAPIDAEVSGLDEWLIGIGVKQDPRIPEEEQVDTMTKIKSAGKAGLAAYAITEGAFWVISIPLAIGAVTASTGTLPDLSTNEGRIAVFGYSFGFLNIARLLVPFRVALALALTPWVDQNIMSRFGGDNEDETSA